VYIDSKYQTTGGNVAFSDILNELIQSKGISKNTLIQTTGISRQYFYDILASRAPAPKQDVQLKLASVLELTELERIAFFESASEERNDFPADLAAMFDTLDKRNELRISYQYSYINSSGDADAKN
jgi:transcriptional regulator with XRE-family HTH domain